MDKLAEVETEGLQAALATVSIAKTAKRLMIALACADGVRVETLNERYEIPRATVYSCSTASIISRLATQSKTNPGPDAHPSLLPPSGSAYPMIWRNHRLSWNTMYRYGRLSLPSATLNKYTMLHTHWDTPIDYFMNSDKDNNLYTNY
ncbi:hypothetical protein MUK72_15735 (plasmid) [Halococcus dombrowskii]|uniref:Uncharacterized protein n=1 Tax=Halococcus dombrowskii TaxID=179637 RepID=A0AAV3SF19_HALDO|nr:hypothetical protein [Halococcus dombrowskii]UOO96644.1 hypothetical protein MUK72_15735 [Halococcus dombrowskii]